MNVANYKVLVGIMQSVNERKNILEIPKLFFKQDFSGMNHMRKLGRYRMKLKLPRQCLKTAQFKESLEEAESSAIVGLEKIWDENLNYQVFETEEKRKVKGDMYALWMLTEKNRT